MLRNIDLDLFVEFDMATEDMIQSDLQEKQECFFPLK